VSFKEVSLVVYDVLQFGWKEMIAQGILIIAIVAAWAAGFLDTDTAAKIISAIIALSNLGAGYKVYKLSKQSVRPRG
jgi:hypothetical protein